jgi:hypothetical protein
MRDWLVVDAGAMDYVGLEAWEAQRQAMWGALAGSGTALQVRHPALLKPAHRHFARTCALLGAARGTCTGARGASHIPPRGYHHAGPVTLLLLLG